MSVVEARNLTKVFRDFWFRPKVRAVNALDLTIAEGEVFGLLGPNGSGKSTTIKLLLGLLHPTAGDVTVLGRRPGNVQAKRRIGYLPEDSYLYQHLTARETVDFHGRLFAIPRAERRRRTEALLEQVGLTDAADRPVGEFSKGMGRRVGLAQALIGDPSFVILDEPTAGLDPIGTREVKNLITELAAAGKTVLLTSHLLADVEDVCDSVMILMSGNILAQGDLRELLEQRDQVRLTIEGLNPAELNALCATIQTTYRRSPRIDHPSIGLEAFFLQVVEKARGAAGATNPIPPRPSA